MTVLAGVTTRDVTPPPGTAMSGFVARRQPASGVHDPLLVQALVVDDTAVVTVDVVGLHEDDCAEIRRRCALPASRVAVHATHTHGGPVSMRGRLGGPRDDAWFSAVVDDAVSCIDEAATGQVPVRVVAGMGHDPRVAHNRRRAGGPVDRALPVTRFLRADGAPLATVVSYACHPVVLAADNTELTADYPGVVRRRLSAATGGAPALFLTGCAGDANTGHTAAASISTSAAPGRTFEECRRVGDRVADSALAAALTPSDGPVAAATAEVLLPFEPVDLGQIPADVARWRSERASADPAATALLNCWITWGERAWSTDQPPPWPAAVTVIRWGGVFVVALPGEPFAAAALALRSTIDELVPGAVTIVAGYSNGVPGYLPAAEEYPLGGYEVLDAHRYYGMQAPFAPGSLEAVVDGATGLVVQLLKCR